MNSAPNHLRLDYLEFAVPDVAAAKKFYAAVFGWAFTDYGPDYTSFTDGHLNGGFFTKPGAPAPTNPLAVIFSADLEHTEAAVRAAGGVITVATREFPGGRRFDFADPNGLILSVWCDKRTDGTVIA